MTLKRLGEVRWIEKAGFRGDITHVVPLRQPQLGLVSMERETNGLAEDAGKMKGAQVGHLRQILQGDLLGIVRLQVLLDALDGRVFLVWSRKASY